MLAPSRRAPSAWRPDAVAAPATVYIGLGSNLGDRLGTLRAATRLLREGAVPGTVLVRCSPVYETRPLGPSTGAYLNAVAELRTVAEPAALLAALLELELRHGRTRRERWASRTLDLDLLVWEEERGDGQRVMVELDGPALRLPHPELEHRDFVLAPLAALAPELRPHGSRAGVTAGVTAGVMTGVTAGVMTATVTEMLAALQPGERTIVAQLGELLC